MTITIGTDCSGIEAPIEALKQLGIPFVHKWACEKDKFARMSIIANCAPEVMYTDITERDHSQLPDVDLYVCGFPCQSFSCMGKKQGTKDPRGNIMLHCIDVIKQKRPNVFILENVKNFMYIEEGNPFHFLLGQLEQLVDDENRKEYNILFQVLNTKDYGIPQNRERLYIVGVKTQLTSESFSFPPKTTPTSLENLLLEHSICNFPMKKNALKVLNRKKINTSQNWVISCAGYGTSMLDCTPSLTCSTPFYLTKYKRYVSSKERLLLQGFNADFAVVVSETQLIRQIGNSMSVNVVKSILARVIDTTLLQHTV